MSNSTVKLSYVSIYSTSLQFVMVYSYICILYTKFSIDGTSANGHLKLYTVSLSNDTWYSQQQKFY